MNKELLVKVKKELIYVLICAVFLAIIFKIIFYKEDVIAVSRLVISLLWSFALPGYFLMLYWHDKLEFRERFVVGIALSAAIIGISSYYLGIIGVNIKWHGLLLPFALIAIGLVVNLFKKKI